MELPERIARARSENPGARIDCYVLFDSHTDAMQLFEASRAEGLGVRVSATPRQARSCCGVALLVDCDDAEQVAKLAAREAIPIQDIAALPNQINPLRDVYC